MTALTYLPPAVRDQARRLLKRADTVTATGSGADMPFEQALSALGHAVLKDKAPGLLDYEVGFQTVDKNDDNTRAVGVFGFRVGRQWLYAPIFFLEGDVKGHDLLYIKNQDLWVPLKENWLNYLIGKKPYVLGKGVGRNLAAQGVQSADYHQLSRSPAKWAADDSDPPARDWAAPFRPAFGHAVTSAPALPENTDLLSFLKSAGAPAARAFVGLAQDYPALVGAVSQFYPDDDVVSAIKQAACVEKASPPTGNFSSQNLGEPLPPKVASAPSAPKAALLFLRHAGADPRVTAVLTDPERQKLLVDGYLVLDKRAEDEKTEAFEVDEPEGLQSPGESGLYEVLTSPGEFEQCAVLKAPYSHRKRHDGVLVVRTSDGAWLYTDASRVLTRSQKDRQEFLDWVKDLPEAGKGDGPFVLVGPTGQQASLPCYGMDGLGDGVWEARFVDSPAVDRPASTLGREGPVVKDPFTAYATRCRGKVVQTGARGMYFRAAGDALYVPAGTRKLTLHRGYCPCGSDSEPPPILELANLVDMHLGIIRAGNLKEMEVKKASGGKFRVDGGPALDRLGALEALVAGRGLGEKCASDLLDRAGRDSATRVFLRYPGGEDRFAPAQSLEKGAAPEYMLQREAPHAPPFPEVPPARDDEMGGLTDATYPWQARVRADVYNGAQNREELRPRTDEWTPYNDGGRPGPGESDSVGAALGAARSGQKEVFDTHVIGSIAKRTKVESITDEVLPASVDAMNAYGRALANLYYNREAWEERFGASEVPDLEDLLQSTFEGLGDAVLRLREGTVEPGPDDGALPDFEGKPY